MEDNGGGIWLEDSSDEFWYETDFLWMVFVLPSVRP